MNAYEPTSMQIAFLTGVVILGFITVIISLGKILEELKKK